MSLPKTAYPLKYSQMIAKLKATGREAIKSNNLLYEDTEQEQTFRIRTRLDDKFEFTIISPQKIQGQDLGVAYSMTPKSEVSLGVASDIIKFEQLEIFLSKWIELMNAYNVVNFEAEDPLQKNISDEIFDSFELEEDADEIPFNESHLNSLFNFLKESKYENADLQQADTIISTCISFVFSFLQWRWRSPTS